MNLGSKILILYAVGWHIRQNISLVAPRQRGLQATIYTNKTNVPADLHVLLSTAKNLPEYNIRIFNH